MCKIRVFYQFESNNNIYPGFCIFSLFKANGILDNFIEIGKIIGVPACIQYFKCDLINEFIVSIIEISGKEFSRADIT